MISFGKNLTVSADPLEKIQVKQLYDMLRNPSPETVSMIRQLRVVRDLDKKQYATLKRRLPYTVAAVFNPAFRLTENFAYAEHFFLDIDHLSEGGLSPDSLRERLKADPRVELCFASPGEDGLKVLFRLSERCYDAGQYSIFYKTFAAKFAHEYGLDQVIDSRTSDVTRACFVSMDSEAFFHPEAVPVVMADFVDFGNPEEASFREKMAEAENEDVFFVEENVHEKDPDAEVMDRIKSLLNPKKAKPEKMPFVPEELNIIMEGLKTFVESTGVELYEVVNIQYGKKLRLRMGHKLAETNLFYGRRGFTVVQSPRNGTNEELNGLMAELIESFLATLE